jgi:CRP/FNR family cyclic AMP-dependent transcriptional regulator
MFRNAYWTGAKQKAGLSLSFAVAHSIICVSSINYDSKEFSMPCDIKQLDGIPLFDLLDPEDRQAVSEVVDYQQLSAGQNLFHAGEPGDSLFIVHSGQIELYIKDTAGQKIVLTIAESRDLFGELSLLDNEPRTATAVALTDSGLLVLDRDDLLLLFKKNPDCALHMLAGMGQMTRKADKLLRTRVSRNVNEEMEVKSTLLQKIADGIAYFSGSMPFLILNGAWFIIWIALNKLPLGFNAFDPYPFGFLTMIVSLEAIFLSCFVLISQNRQTEKDRVRSDIEYEVNIKAELEVAHLHEKTDRIYESMLERFAKLEKMLSQASENS